MPTIAVSPFVQRQTPSSKFSHFEGSWDELQALVVENFDKALPGYRDGVLRIPVPPERFLNSIVELREGDRLVGSYERRAPNEEPRKSTAVIAPKQPALAVEIILYRHDVLMEDNTQSCDAEWEIISVNARMTEEAPMSPGTLMANHFQISGGTATNMSDSEFVAALRASFMYWRNKALCMPEP